MSDLIPSTSVDLNSPLNETLFSALRSGVNASIVKATVAAMKAMNDAELTDGDTVQTLGYTAAGDGGHGRYRWNASDSSADNAGTVIQPDSLPGTGRFNLLWNGSLPLRQFGANATTDSTDAINAAIAVIRSLVTQPDVLARPYFVDGEGGVYRVDGSLDATGFTLGRNWGIRNLTLDAHAAGKVVLDLTGSRFGVLRDVHIWGDQTDVPATGIQFSVMDSGGTQPCDQFLCDNVSVDGYFLKAGLHVYAAEENLFNGCKFWNRQVAAGPDEAWAAILEGTDYKGTTSEFQAIPTGRKSFTVNEFLKCSIKKPFGIAGPTLFLQDAANLRITTGYITNGSGAAIVWRLTAFVPYRIVIDAQIETTGNGTFINFTSDAAATRTVLALECILGNIFTEDQVFLLDTLTGLTLNQFGLNIPRWNTSVPTNFVFNDKSLVTIFGGDVVLPAFNDFNDALTFASYKGTVQAVDGTLRIYGEQLIRAGQLTLSDGSIQSNAQATIADDDAIQVSVPPGTVSGTFLFWTDTANVGAMVLYRANATPIILVSTLGSATETVTNTTLTGTTGSDAKVTLAVNNGVIMIENRSGSGLDANWMFLAR
jgi:hypothetical protein